MVDVTGGNRCVQQNAVLGASGYAVARCSCISSVNLIFRDPVHDARRCGQVSLWRITREASREELGRGGEVEAVQDVTLAAGQSHGMDDAAQGCVFLYQGTDPKSAKDAFRSQALFGPRRMGGNRLAVFTLHEGVAGQTH